MSYTAIPSEKGNNLPEDQESLLSHHEEIYLDNRIPKKSWLTRLIYTGFCISVLANIAAALAFLFVSPRSLDDTCSKYTTQHASPVSDAIPIKYVTQKVNGSFYHETIYRQPASPEVDAAWKELIGDEPPHIAIPVSQAERFGLKPWQAKLDPATPGLEDATEPHILTDVEVFHQLHCVDLLRKGSYWDYPYYEAQEVAIKEATGIQGAFANGGERARKHWSHCLDMVRQRIMCSADIEVFGQVWVGDSVNIMFTGERKCRNFDDIHAWVEENRIQANAEGKIELSRFPGDFVFEHKQDIP